MYDINYKNTLDETDDVYFLEYFSAYNHYKTGQISFTYEDKDSPSFVHLRESLEILNIKDEENDLNIIKRLCSWVNNTLSYGINKLVTFQDQNTSWDTLTILQQVKENRVFCDCGTHAIVLTEILLALGYKAKWIQCLPIDLRYSDSHCVTHVYSKDFGKWIIADAALNLLYFNTKGIPMSLPELRQALLNSERVLFPSKTIRYRQWLLHYWKKNIIRFHTFSDYKYGFFTASNQTHYYLNPVNYKICNKRHQLRNGVISHIHISNPDEFWS